MCGAREVHAFHGRLEHCIEAVGVDGDLALSVGVGGNVGIGREDGGEEEAGGDSKDLPCV